MSEEQRIEGPLYSRLAICMNTLIALNLIKRNEKQLNDMILYSHGQLVSCAVLFDSRIFSVLFLLNLSYCFLPVYAFSEFISFFFAENYFNSINAFN